MKTRLFAIAGGAILLIGVFVISPAYASFTDSVLVQVSGEFKKVYYNEKNVASVFFDPDLTSVVFETGNDAILEIKAPKVHKMGPGILILKNGEEIDAEPKTDDCFYYITVETKTPETIEIAFAYWPEYSETVDGCETFAVAPLKQVEMGISFDKIQCKQNLVLIQKYDGSPACVTESTKTKLIERGWTGNKIQNITQDFFSKYEMDYDELVVRNAKASIYKTVQEHPNQNCFTLTDDMLDYFPDGFLEDLESAAEEEFHTDPQIYPPGVYTGYGMLADKDFALDFVKKYDFNATKQVFSDNIASIPDKQYHFYCFFDYSDKQYMLRLTFEQQLYDGNFVNVNVTRNDQDLPTIINDNITVYGGGFNSTVLFHNKLDSDIVLSSDEPIVYHIDGDGDIYENTFAKTLSEFEQVIPPEKFFSYYFAAHREKINQPITYVIEPYDLKGIITVKQYPRCMTESQVVSLYNEVKVYPKFPSYLPDGYSFECGVHNTNAFVHLVYSGIADSDNYESIYDRKYLADGGLVIDYYDEAWNGWNEDPNYDKHEKANENAAHPWAETYTISGEPAVMIEEYFWQNGEQRSFNRLEVFFDEDKVRISSSLPKTELIKIAESLQVRK